jgi:hypothetical protein
MTFPAQNKRKSPSILRTGFYPPISGRSREKIDSAKAAERVLEDRRMVYLRSGDSLEVHADLFPKKDTLCWLGGGRLPKDNVLAFRIGEKQWVMNDRTNGLLRVRPTKDVRQPCDRGELLTMVYKGSKTAHSAINATNAQLLQDPNVRACFMLPKQKEPSYVSIGAGAGPGHGMLGLRTVLGPNGSGLTLGLGNLENQFCFSAGLQLLLSNAFYLNASYGTYEVGSISRSSGLTAKKYKVDGYNFFMGFTPHFGAKKKFFIEAGIGYSGGGTAPGPFGNVKSQGVGFDGGIGYQL